MLLPPVVIALVWFLTAWSSRQGRTGPRRSPVLPVTRVGQAALAAMLLTAVVFLVPDPLPPAIPIGVVLFVLAFLARRRYRDPGLLLIVPLVFGAWFAVVPSLYLIWGALHPN